MLYEDLNTLLTRLDRIARAQDLGCTSIRHNYRPEVAAALVETCWEGVRLGHELTRRLAYDDLWSDLDTLLNVWQQIASQTGRVAQLEIAAVEVAEVTQELMTSFVCISQAVAAMDDAQLRVRARPRDQQAMSTATAAIRTLEGFADRLFVDALSEDHEGRLDAAMALLTAIASRAARERAAVSSRRR
ncbi:MAG: hypothetical protein ACR2HR_08935 [Euzebya sp.]